MGFDTHGCKIMLRHIMISLRVRRPMGDALTVRRLPFGELDDHAATTVGGLRQGHGHPLAQGDAALVYDAAQLPPNLERDVLRPGNSGGQFARGRRGWEGVRVDGWRRRSDE